MSKVASVEFGVCVKASNGEEELGFIPIDKGVQSVLLQMRRSTRDKLGLKDKSKDLHRFEPAQQYGEKETLWMPLADENLVKIRGYCSFVNIQTSSYLLSDIKLLSFYFAVFHLENGKKIWGFRRTTQFKGVLSAKGRLVQLIDDSLQIADDHIFKLDIDFDFLVTEKKVYIMRPAALCAIADLNKYVMATASSALKQISNELDFIAFNSMVDYVGKHVRPAKLIASLRARNDLNLISKDQLVTYCKENKILYKIDGDGKIVPVKGHELGFLLLLDRRRYSTELIPGLPERYEAPNRRGIK